MYYICHLVGSDKAQESPTKLEANRKLIWLCYNLVHRICKILQDYLIRVACLSVVSVVFAEQLTVTANNHNAIFLPFFFTETKVFAQNISITVFYIYYQVLRTLLLYTMREQNHDGLYCRYVARCAYLMTYNTISYAATGIQPLAMVPALELTCRLIVKLNVILRTKYNWNVWGGIEDQNSSSSFRHDVSFR